MKLTTLLAAVIATAAIGGQAMGPNAERMARGLPPLPPVRRSRGTGTSPNRPRPSNGGGINNSCNTGPVQCCNSVTTANPITRSLLSKLLGIVVGPDVALGFTCSPLSIVGAGHGGRCQQQPVCCENNEFNGLVAIGCSPINVNLT